MIINDVLQGDCNDILSEKISSESIDFVYMDPPFYSNRKYFAVSPNGDRSIAFNDCFNSIVHYLQWIKPRIEQCYRVLKKTGSFYIHCDYHAVHYLKILCDEIFGISNFINEIIWRRQSNSKTTKYRFGNVVDHILLYSKSKKYTFNMQYIPVTEKYFPYLEKETGRRYKICSLEAPGNHSPSLIYRGKKYFPAATRSFMWTQETFDCKIKDNPYLIIISKNDKLRYKLYYDEYPGVKMCNLWDDIPPVSGNHKQFCNYPTQKPLDLLERIIKTSTNPGDIVLDPLCGSGTALIAASLLDRKFIGIDISSLAVEKTIKRLKENTSLNKWFPET